MKSVTKTKLLSNEVILKRTLIELIEDCSRYFNQNPCTEEINTTGLDVRVLANKLYKILKEKK